ncbi:MAG: methyltransferase domain-containing protein [Methanoregulaceae archaeon]|nr:methyltransferase domain-containing protein [Methanoregulaceae archaeon]
MLRNKIQHHFDSIAHLYDDRYDGTRGRRYHAHLSEYMMRNLVQGGRLLDLGCGTGLFVTRYIGNGGEAVGLDISRGMIRKAIERCPESDFTMASAEAIPFSDGSFDALSSLLVFSYVRSPEKMLSEAYRVLRPGGSLAICTLGKNLMTSGLPAIYHLGEVMRVRQVCVGAFGERYYHETEMEDLLRHAGFTGVRVLRCSFAHYGLIDPVFDIAKKVEPFVEKHLPSLAYNIFAVGRKPPV